MKALFFALFFSLSSIAASVSSQTVAFTNVSVIPMDRERVLTNQTVVIKNGLIAEIGNAKNVKLPKDSVRIDGTGKYLVPGLVDMHTHLLSDSNEFPDTIGPDELRVRCRSFQLRGARGRNQKPVNVSRDHRQGRHDREREASRPHFAKR
jgi:predicted amidohydrolase YtcJ